MKSPDYTQESIDEFLINNHTDRFGTDIDLSMDEKLGLAKKNKRTIGSLNDGTNASLMCIVYYPMVGILVA